MSWFCSNLWFGGNTPSTVYSKFNFFISYTKYVVTDPYIIRVFELFRISFHILNFYDGLRVGAYFIVNMLRVTIVKIIILSLLAYVGGSNFLLKDVQ